MMEWKALHLIQEKGKVIEAREVKGERVWDMPTRDEFIKTMQYFKINDIEVTLEVKFQRLNLSISDIEDVLDRMGVTLNKRVFYKELGYDY